MRNNTLLIDEAYIKAYSIVSDNLDSKYLQPSIIEAQDIYLEPLIGSQLMNKLSDLVTSEDIEKEENELYKYLLDKFVQPFLLNKVCSIVQFSVFAKIRNAGVMQYNDTQENSVNIENVNFMRKHFEDNAKFYAERMTDYLIGHRQQFPEWNCKCSNWKEGDVPSDPQRINTCNIHI